MSILLYFFLSFLLPFHAKNKNVFDTVFMLIRIDFCVIMSVEVTCNIKPSYNSPFYFFILFFFLSLAFDDSFLVKTEMACRKGNLYQQIISGLFDSLVISPAPPPPITVRQHSGLSHVMCCSRTPIKLQHLI